MRDHICPNCGISNKFFVLNSIYRCRECKAPLYTPTPEPMNRWDLTIRYIFYIYRWLYIVAVANVIVYYALLSPLFGMTRRSSGVTGRSSWIIIIFIALFQISKTKWYLLAIIFGIGAIPFLILYLIKKDKPRKKTFAVLDGSYLVQNRNIRDYRYLFNIRPPLVPVNYDIKVKLDVENLKKPNEILYTYTTYELSFENNVHVYPVLLGVQLLNYKIIYYELSFLGKHSGVKLPALHENQKFTMRDYLGNIVSGSILTVYPQLQQPEPELEPIFSDETDT